MPKQTEPSAVVIRHATPLIVTSTTPIPATKKEDENLG
jgi:hypothetical protein